MIKTILKSIQEIEMKVRELKIKIKSLAEEQRIIKHEEKKAGKHDRYHWRRLRGDQPFLKDYYFFDRRFAEVSRCCFTRDTLRTHRVHHVRPKIRAALIAYAFIRGKAADGEKGCKTEPDWSEVVKNLKTFSESEYRRGLFDRRLPEKLQGCKAV